MLGKAGGGRERGQPNRRWVDSVKEAAAFVRKTGARLNKEVILEVIRSQGRCKLESTRQLLIHPPAHSVAIAHSLACFRLLIPIPCSVRNQSDSRSINSCPPKISIHHTLCKQAIRVPGEWAPRGLKIQLCVESFQPAAKDIVGFMAETTLFKTAQSGFVSTKNRWLVLGLLTSGMECLEIFQNHRIGRSKGEKSKYVSFLSFQVLLISGSEWSKAV